MERPPIQYINWQQPHEDRRLKIKKGKRKIAGSLFIKHNNFNSISSSPSLRQIPHLSSIFFSLIQTFKSLKFIPLLKPLFYSTPTLNILIYINPISILQLALFISRFLTLITKTGKEEEIIEIRSIQKKSSSSLASKN